MFGFFKKKQAVKAPAPDPAKENLEDWERIGMSQVLVLATPPAEDLQASYYGDFENVKHTEVEPQSVEDLRSIHAIHVAATYSHVLAPYPISGHTPELLTTTYHPDTPEGKAKAARDIAFHEWEEWVNANNNPYHAIGATIDVTQPRPRARETLRVVHIRGNTEEVPIDSEFGM
ncbi:hypothetical protein Slin15195_G104140 [Septoria linicola]|uniref:Uncharacterized protein n=1 Tax=Septoria linicola TaxID=215465 RepID=A0A9Q9AXT2_9PEZI|nr:hypothetical protein Slin14017_G067180 [Septoria linicola]USW57095.1 hypothetical protein Slin15195_G104140 [Septoria linicola]